MKERHQILKRIGAGGFGSVYEALDTELNRKVAIKRLKADSYVDHIELRDQLLTEAKVLAGLHHPNIVAIYDVIQTPDGGDIVMELIEGQTLNEVIEKGPIDINQFLFIATQLLSAIAVAHDHNILHCDLKPGNVMLTKLEDENYQAKVLDFGMSPSVDEESLTKSGRQKLIGSIHFMAPEQIDGGNTSTQSDIYSLGCLFYYLLTGKYPFDGESSVMVMASHVTGNYVPLRQLCPDLPKGFCAWVESHFQFKPEDRVSSCRDSLAALVEIKGLQTLETFSEVFPGSKLSNTMLHSLSSLSKANVKISENQKQEFAKKKGVTPHTKKNLIPLADRYKQARPEDQWFFAVDNVRKGPINYAKVCELIAKGYIRANDTIWHVRLGQWTPAAQVKEFHEEFKQAFSMPPREVKKKVVVNPRNTEAVRNKAKATQPVAKPSTTPLQSPPIEIAITSAFTIVAVMVVLLLPDYWQHTLLILGVLLFLFGMVFNRFKMFQINRGWLIAGLLFPFVSDLLLALAKPKKGAQSLIIILLAVAFVYYAIQHRYTGDLLSSPVISETVKLLTP